MPRYTVERRPDENHCRRVQVAAGLLSESQAALVCNSYVELQKQEVAC